MPVIYFNYDDAALDREVLKDLKGHGRLGIISAHSPKAVTTGLRHAGVDDLFESDLFIQRTGQPVEIYAEAAKRARVTKDQAFYVDKDVTEVGHATNAGIYGTRDSSRIALLKAKAVTTNVAIPEIDACTSDARLAALNNDAGPANETNFDKLLQRLDAAKARLPLLYVTAAEEPFAATLTSLGQSGFSHILVTQPKTGAPLMIDISHSILQNGERFLDTATDAFEEVVTDLYDGFLSAEDRKGIKAPDRTVLPPLVKWGNPDDGPYTWPIDATSNFNLQCAVVNLPPANATAGLVAWAALAHETAGHDVIHADHGLEAELSQAVQTALAPLGQGLAEYWSQRIDETASDVCGILNMGPAPAIGLVSYFRGLNDAFGDGAHLRTEGPANDPHPADILRGYLAAETVRHLSFTASAAWANLIDAETEKDATGQFFKIAGTAVSKSRAINSARIVARTIATHKAAVLNNHALIEIQDWRDSDETIVKQITPALTTTTALPANLAGGGIYAAHVVAAAVTAALAGIATPAVIFKRMISILKSMHDSDPSWGPLKVVHPSSIYRDFAYRR